MLTAEKITHNGLDRGQPTPRDILFIGGMPFYRSSGNNSGAAGMWFPFLGIQLEGEGVYGRGWYIKNILFNQNKEHYIPEDLANMVRLAIGGKEILQRFSSVPGLLISSLLGGGRWDDELGKQLKTHLEKTYPDFYQAWPTITVAAKGQEFGPNDLEGVDNWLLAKANFSKLEDFENNFVKELKDLKAPTVTNLNLNLIENYGDTSSKAKKPMDDFEDWVDLAKPQHHILPGYQTRVRDNVAPIAKPTRSLFKFW